MHPSLLILLLTGTALAQSILPSPPEPPANPTTPQKALLGKALFWDEQLSSTRSIACGTCHVFAHGGADPRAEMAVHPGADGLFGSSDDGHGSPGVSRHAADGSFAPSALFGAAPQVTRRRAPSVINAAYASSLFADGRATDTFLDPVTQTIALPSGGALENQSTNPPVDTTEMAHIGRTWTEIANELPGLTPLALATAIPLPLQQFVAGQTYDALFAQVFGSPGVTPVRIAFALAAYERTLISDQSPLDLYLAGQGTLSGPQLYALGRFQTLCGDCHTDLDPAVLTTGPQVDFRNIGVRPPSEDLGRAIVTGNPADRGKFRVPGLRNVALRPPYFHNGSMATLDDVLDFYARAGDFADNRDPLVDAIQGHMSLVDHGALRSLLDALTDPRVVQELPPFDRPHLWSEGPDRATAFGTGTVAAGAPGPRIFALGAGHLGNATLGLAVDRLAPGLLTALLVDTVGGSAAANVLGHETWLGLSPDLQFVLTPPTAAAPGGGGFSTAVVRVPASPALAGTYWLQWLALDPNGPNGFASSPSLSLPIF